MRKIYYYIFMMFLCVSVSSFSMFTKNVWKPFPAKHSCIIVTQGTYAKEVIGHKLYFGGKVIPSTTTSSKSINGGFQVDIVFDDAILRDILCEVTSAKIQQSTITSGKVKFVVKARLELELQFADMKFVIGGKDSNNILLAEISDVAEIDNYRVDVNMNEKEGEAFGSEQEKTWKTITLQQHGPNVGYC